ncbi:MAG: efflux RND transporter periplasmic adaptor subunit [Gammaproteobacteria bacterium]|nr:efflux RND transporter periplasmic adaptor subunit [Gammaproteobacteria bacterium]
MRNNQWFTTRPADSAYLLSRLLLAVSLIISFQLQAEKAYYRTDNSNQSAHTSGKVFYPTVQRGGKQHGSIITVTNAKTGAHVVLGGTVKPYREVTLTAQTPGRVEFIAGSEGEWFDEGQILVAIDDDDVLAQRQQAMADLYGRSSTLQDARAQYSREFWAPQALQQQQQQTAPSMGYFPSMFEKFMGFGGGPSSGGYPSYNGLNPWVVRDVDLYSQGTHVDQAQSGIHGARSRIDEIDARLRDTRAISPFEGVIVKKVAEVGDTVQPGQALLQFADIRFLQLKVDVPARLVSALSEDMVVPAKLDVGDTYIDVRVAQIFPVADSQRHTVVVKFDLPEGVPGGPGMYAEVMIPDVNTPIADMPIIPSSAIVRRGSLPAVFVLNHEGRAEMRLVRLGDEVDNENVAVLSGISPGEQIFASPSPGIRSGWTPDFSK